MKLWSPFGIVKRQARQYDNRPSPRTTFAHRRADQLVADADKVMRDVQYVDEWMRAEDLREMLVEMRARIEARIERDGR